MSIFDCELAEKESPRTPGIRLSCVSSRHMPALNSCGGDIYVTPSPSQCTGMGFAAMSHVSSGRPAFSGEKESSKVRELRFARPRIEPADFPLVVDFLSSCCNWAEDCNSSTMLEVRLGVIEPQVVVSTCAWVEVVSLPAIILALWRICGQSPVTSSCGRGSLWQLCNP